MSNDEDKNKKVSILNEDIQTKIDYEKENIIRANKKKGLGKAQLFFTIIMGLVVLFGIVYTLVSQLK
ncbi:hypothetical protein [Leuconostoc palmae]|uniref:hypothetical protein n=1 Tax=Leuconostoc palmae TaxID=501487 RepID=UPI001C7D2478|nr:hypothetical protein [Leuconostoc palmae]